MRKISKVILKALYWRFKSAAWAFRKGIDVQAFFEEEHDDPANCPSYYDGCNCYMSVWNENEYLHKRLKEIGPNDILKKII